MPSEVEEIETILRKHLIPHHVLGGRQLTIADLKLAELVAAIAALRAQDRAEGAREMRERAAACAAAMPSQVLYFYPRPGGAPGNSYGPLSGRYVAEAIRALPLSPAEAEDGDARDRETIRQLEEELGVKGTSAVFREALRRAKAAGEEARLALAEQEARDA